ncbi:MAG: molybdenum cofactor biosynthesis protein MoaE [Proteobacteria bacterium]|nr:molybdenum cofactor biosynthesis protein MoaE [Pseudomonadota bacterium]MBU6424931.1 molybdenum cofactor biosynthesis protein MoaE [Rhodospirillales bacterium]
MRLVAVQEQDFDAGALLARLSGAGTGGLASFIGIVRQAPDGGLKALCLEYYPGMTEKALERLADEAEARWALTGCIIIHRVGRLEPGQNIVFTAAASAHRGNALAATAYLIDQLKTRAPFWKAEEMQDGTTSWVDAREADDATAAAWNTPASPENLP